MLSLLACRLAHGQPATPFPSDKITVNTVSAAHGEIQLTEMTPVT
jgi:hypothetical protein